MRAAFEIQASEFCIWNQMSAAETSEHVHATSEGTEIIRFSLTSARKKLSSKIEIRVYAKNKNLVPVVPHLKGPSWETSCANP